MIIVSQEKNFIVNFNDIDLIELDKCNGMYRIRCVNKTIAEYKTEERAKQVLKEFISSYECNTWDCINNCPIYRFVYEMPTD